MVLQVLERRRRSAQAAILEPYDSQALLGIPRMLNADRPAARIPRLRSQRINAAMAAVEQGTGDIPFLCKQFRDAVQRVTFANAAQIDFQSGS